MLSRTVALVSGGSSGLGAATVKSLVQDGAKVMVADLPSQEQLFHAMSKDMPRNRVAFSPVDVTNASHVSDCLDTIERVFGEKVNVAVNCAGIATAGKTVSKKGPHSISEFTRVLQVNTIGTFTIASLAAERMIQRETNEDGLKGCIINTASIAAFEGQVGQVAYASSKGAVVAMTLPMARDLAAFGVRVMTIAPGLFATPLLEGLPDKIQSQLGESVPCPTRLGSPNEFGSLVCSIIANPYLNGTVIRLDGALRMPP